MALVVLTGAPATTIMQAASKGAACFFFRGVRAKKSRGKTFSDSSAQPSAAAW
jgi:hypothetical protein